MHLENVPELRVTIGLAWEIPRSASMEVPPEDGRAADKSRGIGVLWEKAVKSPPAHDRPGWRPGGTKWVVRPVVGRPDAKEVGVGR
jgi:hypothetical protein